MKVWVLDTIRSWKQLFRLHGHILTPIIGAFLTGATMGEDTVWSGIFLFLSIVGVIPFHQNLMGARRKGYDRRYDELGTLLNQKYPNDADDILQSVRHCHPFEDLDDHELFPTKED